MVRTCGKARWPEARQLLTRSSILTMGFFGASDILTTCRERSIVRNSIAAGLAVGVLLLAGCSSTEDAEPSTSPASDPEVTATEPAAVASGPITEFVGEVVGLGAEFLASNATHVLVTGSGSGDPVVIIDTAIAPSGIELPLTEPSAQQAFAYEDGFILLASTHDVQGVTDNSGTHVYRVNPDGTIAWQVEATGDIDLQSGVVAARGETGMIGIDAETGDTLWTTDQRWVLASAPDATGGDGFVVHSAGLDESSISLYDARTGEQRWEVPLAGEDPFASDSFEWVVTPHDSVVEVRTEYSDDDIDEHVVLDRETGARTDNPDYWVLDSTADGLIVAFPRNVEYTQQRKSVGLLEADGTFRWSFEPSTGSLGFVDAGEYIYAWDGQGSKQAAVLDPATGEQLSFTQFPEDTYGGVVGLTDLGVVVESESNAVPVTLLK
jgi:hypothetical protein